MRMPYCSPPFKINAGQHQSRSNKYHSNNSPSFSPPFKVELSTRRRRLRYKHHLLRSQLPKLVTAREDGNGGSCSSCECGYCFGGDGCGEKRCQEEHYLSTPFSDTLLTRRGFSREVHAIGIGSFRYSVFKGLSSRCFIDLVSEV